MGKKMQGTESTVKSGVISGGIAKKKRAPKKNVTRTISAPDGTRTVIDNLTVKTGETVIIDTTGKGYLRIGKITLCGGKLGGGSAKNPLELVVNK